MNFGKINQRLSLGLLLITAIPLAGLGWLYTNMFEQTLKELQLTHLSSVANKKANNIDDYVSTKLGVNQLLAKTRAMSSVLHILPAIVEREGINSPRYQAEQRTFNDHFRTLLGNIDYHDLLVMDAKGNVVFSIAKETDLGTNLVTGPYRNTALAKAHRDTLSTLTSQISETQLYAPSGNIPALFLLSPVVEAGKMLGTVALQLDMNKLAAEAADITGLGESGETVLAQLDGDEALYLVPLKYIKDAAFHQRIPLVKTAAPMQAALLGAHAQGIAKDYAGVKVIAAWRYLPALHWGMVVKMDTTEAFAPLYRLRRLFLYAVGILLLTSLVAAWLFGQMLTAPIHRLIAVTNKIAAGKLEQRAPVTGWQELQQLASSVNRMIDRLLANHSELESNIAELGKTAGRLNNTQRIARIGDYEFDLHSGQLTWSDTACSLFGFKPGSAPPTIENLLAHIHPEDAANVDAAIRGLPISTHPASNSQQAPLPDLEYRVIHPDGSLHWLHTEGFAQLDDNGDPVRVWGTVQDMTAAKLPAQTPPAASGIAGHDTATDDSVPVTPASTGNHYTLLYVENNPANLHAMQKILARRPNCELLNAVNGEAGLALAIAARPDLIMLDLDLPGMDGLEVLRRLKDNAVTCNIPVIAVTENAMPHDVQFGEAAGFTAYLTKPDVAKFIEFLGLTPQDHGKRPDENIPQPDIASPSL